MKLERSPEQIVAELKRWDGIERRRTSTSIQFPERRIQNAQSCQFNAQRMQMDNIECHGEPGVSLWSLVLIALAIYGLLKLI